LIRGGAIKATDPACQPATPLPFCNTNNPSALVPQGLFLCAPNFFACSYPFTDKFSSSDSGEMANLETQIQQQIRLAVGQRSDLRLFRNNTGSLPDPRTGRPIQFGLAKGSADLIGIKQVTITPEMVGQTIGQFVSLEVKTPTGRVTPQQRNWLTMIRKLGGLAGVVRSVSDALQIFE
jgi:hypothetical protein